MWPEVKPQLKPAATGLFVVTLLAQSSIKKNKKKVGSTILYILLKASITVQFCDSGFS